MPLWHAVLLGVVQGLTEFLPISSTAHLVLAQQLLGYTPEEIEESPFTVVIQLGTLAAVFLYFRRDIIALVHAFLGDVAAGRFIRSPTPESRLWKLIVVGTIPAAVCGLLFKKWLKANFYNAQSIAIVAIVFALLMLAAEIYAARRQRAGKEPRGDAELSWFDALFVGCFQSLALMPGGSRSGTTITAGLFAGLSRPTAARYSFLLSLPIMLAAGFKEIYDYYKQVKANPALQAAAQDQITALVVGTLVSAVVGYISIAWLVSYLKKHSMVVFVAYRILLGLLILGLIWGGVVAPR